jgi:hypothetical protein
MIHISKGISDLLLRVLEANTTCHPAVCTILKIEAASENSNIIWPIFM